ncbi:MAG: N-acetyl-gamma-glutamyl-phosphate reductase [Actinobacteria bacterium]|nr:N-acetyl-gamma-glutamyl-phosphate reductase [Actinomycetota bacterium]
MVSVGVLGASGYGGGELLRLLADHPDFEVGQVWANASAGQSVAELHPHLATLAHLQVAAFDASQLTVDFVFMALPHSQSAQYAAEIEVPVVDLGADFRLEDAAAWSTYYGGQHAGTWTYGLPEIPGQRAKIAESTKVANPGCYATAIAVAAAPLVAAGLVDPTQIVVVAASGTSGAGRSPSVPLMASEVTSGVRAYKVGGVHQHTPEIEQTIGHGARISFTPILAPMARGILATVTAPLQPGVDPDAVGESLHRSYDAETFVRLLPEGQWPATQMTLGTNSVALQWAYDAHAGRVIVCSAIDNLGKGAAGQAIQNANLMLGFPEASGLAVNGVAP